MPRAIVTPSLAETLRNLRLQNRIQVKQIASHIGKSPAFVSRLERGGIKTIDTEELYSILQFISGGESLLALAEQIYKSLTLRYSQKEIEEQVWFTNYDTVKCLLPVPASLIDDLNSRIDNLTISRQYLTERINANEAIPDEEKRDSTIPNNQWYNSKRSQGDAAQSIKISISLDTVNKILDKEWDVAPYIFIFCIVFYLLKIEQFQDTVSITDEQNKEIMQEATEILNSHRFLSIYEKNKLISEKRSKDEILDALSSFDKDNIDVLNGIILGFQFASEQNIKSTNEQLKLFEENMRWDLGFMLRIISIDYTCLKETSVSNKRGLISEIEALVKKYSELSEDQNRIETY